MPEGLGKARDAGDQAPEEEGDGEPEGTAAIVGQEPREEPGQWVEVVEHGASYDLVGEATPTVVELADVESAVLFGVVEDQFRRV